MKIEASHEMRLVSKHSAGAEEWYCPTCGRRFVVQWSPSYNLVIIQPGDPFTPHSGSTGGLKIGPTEIKDADMKSEHDQNSNIWLDGLADIDFSSV